MKLRALLVGVLAGAALGCAGAEQAPAPVPQVVAPRERTRVTLQFQDKALGEILALLAASSGEPVDARVPAGDPIRLTLDLREVPWDQAVEILALGAGLHAGWREVAGERRVVLTRDPAPEPFRAAPSVAKSGPGQAFARLGPRPAPDPKLRIDVDVEDMDLGEVMEQISAKSGARILVDPNVSESVTVALTGIPWFEAVQVIAKMTRTSLEEHSPGVWLLTQPGFVHLNLCNADARTVAQLLAAYSGRNLVVAPGTLEGETTVLLRSDLSLPAPSEGLERALAGLLHVNGADLYEIHDAWLAAPRGSRPELARVPLLAQPMSEPPPLAEGAGYRARARGVPAELWVQTLVNLQGGAILIGKGITGRVDRAMGPLSLLRSVWELARERDWTLQSQAAYLMLQGAQTRTTEGSRRGTRRSLPAPAGSAKKRIVVEFQAWVIPEPESDRRYPVAVLSGRVYYPGDRLLDAEGDELPFRVEAIEPDRVVLAALGARSGKRYLVPFED